ncbi:MAG TPA: GNAT family N-acetyltransferase [Bellilinea sp.]|nr:GNAT family N-acetyltransferase [Bellilinea sp.]
MDTRSNSALRNPRQLPDNAILTAEEYVKDPCGVSSLPWWKRDRVLPLALRVVHERELAELRLSRTEGEGYFKLLHKLDELDPCPQPVGVTIRKVNMPAEADLCAEIIGRCYDDVHPSAEEVISWMDFPVYAPDLWLIAEDEFSGTPLGLGIAEFDPSIGEGILDWIQILPPSRGKGIGKALVSALLEGLSKRAKFVTVSGRIDSPTNPEKLYRSAGFTGDDVWFVFNTQKLYGAKS